MHAKRWIKRCSREELNGGIIILFDQDRLVQLVQMDLQDTSTHLSINLQSSADICDKLSFLLTTFQASAGKEKEDVSVVLI